MDRSCGSMARHTGLFHSMAHFRGPSVRTASRPRASRRSGQSDCAPLGRSRTSACAHCPAILCGFVVSFRTLQCHFVAILGPSGCGSSLLRVVRTPPRGRASLPYPMSGHSWPSGTRTNRRQSLACGRYLPESGVNAHSHTKAEGFDAAQRPGSCHETIACVRPRPERRHGTPSSWRKAPWTSGSATWITLRRKVVAPCRSRRARGTLPHSRSCASVPTTAGPSRTTRSPLLFRAQFASISSGSAPLSVPGPRPDGGGTCHEAL